MKIESLYLTTVFLNVSSEQKIYDEPLEKKPINSKLPFIITPHEMIKFWEPENEWAGYPPGIILPCMKNACFTGIVDPDNFGAYAAVRTDINSANLSNHTAFTITAKANKLATFYLTIVDRKSDEYDAEFTTTFTAGLQKQTISIDLKDFEGPYIHKKVLMNNVKSWPKPFSKVIEIKIFALKPKIQGYFKDTPR